MGQFKNEGSAALALAEECAEVIQIIAKMERFQGDWDEIAPGKDKSRWDMLKEEMDDVIYQWERLKLSLAKSHTCDENGPTYDSAGFTEADR